MNTVEPPNEGVKMPPSPGEFCREHWSWKCQAGQGDCPPLAGRPALHVGDRVRFLEETQRYTVRAVTSGRRFAICTKPFNLKRTVLYTVVDFQRGVRGADNYYGLGYETDQQVESALHSFQHAENEDPPEVTNVCTFEDCRSSATVSRRNYVNLHIASVRPGGDA